LKVHRFTTGCVRLKEGERGARRYLPGGWRQETLPVNVFAVEHEAGVCLFDAGQTALATAPGYFPAWYPFFRLARFELEPEDEAAAQLERIGLAPADVRWLVLSHLHTDHVGGIEPFGGAEVLVSREEWGRAVGLGGRLRGYLPQYWPPTIRPRLVDFPEPADGTPFPSFDIAGDGRLLLVPTPGHTRGHMGLLVHAGERSYFLGGDVAHSASELPLVDVQVASLCERENATFLATHDPRAGDLLAAA
jgi:glyoxylase-like metal-dependent hydrolase (beta-lactamase superfamily II)